MKPIPSLIYSCMHALSLLSPTSLLIPPHLSIPPSHSPPKSHFSVPPSLLFSLTLSLIHSLIDTLSYSLPHSCIFHPSFPPSFTLSICDRSLTHFLPHTDTHPPLTPPSPPPHSLLHLFHPSPTHSFNPPLTCSLNDRSLIHSLTPTLIHHSHPPLTHSLTLSLPFSHSLINNLFPAPLWSIIHSFIHPSIRLISAADCVFPSPPQSLSTLFQKILPSNTNMAVCIRTPPELQLINTQTARPRLSVRATDIGKTTFLNST